MSWVLIQSGMSAANTSVWQIQSASDIDSPQPAAASAAPGSIARTADRSKRYVKDSDGSWVEVIGNNSGSGSGSGSVSITVVHADANGVLDVKAQDLYAAYKSGLVQVSLYSAEDENLSTIVSAGVDSDSIYYFYIVAEGVLVNFVASSGDDYPAIEGNNPEGST